MYKGAKDGPTRSHPSRLRFEEPTKEPQPPAQIVQTLLRPPPRHARNATPKVPPLPLSAVPERGTLGNVVFALHVATFPFSGAIGGWCLERLWKKESAGYPEGGGAPLTLKGTALDFLWLG